MGTTWCIIAVLALLGVSVIAEVIGLMVLWAWLRS